jgi:hypothetical protein
LTQLSVERDRIAFAMLQRLGILTGGGDAPGLNAVIRAVVRTAERVYGAETVGVLDGFSGLIEERFRHLTGADVRPLISLGGTVLGTTNRDNPFAYRREGRTTDRSGEALANAARAGLEALPQGFSCRGTPLWVPWEGGRPRGAALGAAPTPKAKTSRF